MAKSWRRKFWSVLGAVRKQEMLTFREIKKNRKRIKEKYLFGAKYKLFVFCHFKKEESMKKLGSMLWSVRHLKHLNVLQLLTFNAACNVPSFCILFHFNCLLFKSSCEIPLQNFIYLNFFKSHVSLRFENLMCTSYQ